MSKTGVFLSSIVYVGASLFTVFSLSSCTQKIKVAKVIPVETNVQAPADTSQIMAASSGPFQLDGTHQTAQATAAKTRSPASVAE